MTQVHSRYRQQVAQFRQRLDALVTARTPGPGRELIDRSGHASRAIPFKNLEQRLVQYGHRRFESAARVLGLLEFIRDREALHARHRPVEVAAGPVVWQAFQGTRDDNACHTCPTHVQLDGQLPTLITGDHGVRRHLIVELADCMLMPRAINEIDMVVDEQFGRVAFVSAAGLVLNERGMPWQQGVAQLREDARDLMGGAFDALFASEAKTFKADDPADQLRLDMLSAYYEGFFLGPDPRGSVAQLITGVRSEGDASTPAQEPGEAAVPTASEG